MELRQVAYFVAVAEDLSFSRAAARLHVTQPTISQQVQRLEQDLRCRLLERTTGRVRLTREGAVFLVQGRRLLAQARDAREQLSGWQELKLGRVALGALPAVVCYWLPDLLAKLRQEHPGLEVCVVENGTAEILAGVDAGILDLGVVTLPVDASRFASRTLISEPLHLLLPKGHRLAGSRQPVTLREVADEPFLQYSTDSGLRGIVEDTCRRAGFAPHVVLQTVRTESLKRFVAAGLGVGLAPQSTLNSADRHSLCVIAVAERPLRVIGFATSRGAVLSRGAQLAMAAMEGLRTRASSGRGSDRTPASQGSPSCG